MLQTYLMNALIFCGIVLLIALTVGAVLGIFILIDFRKVSKGVREKIMSMLSVVDIVAIITESGVITRLKKVLATIFKSKRREKHG